MSNLTTLPKGDSAWLFRKALERIIQQISVLETNIGSSTTGNSNNTEIIFNDNGVLRGDKDFAWNKTSNILTVDGSATISGDLTVDTSTLKVDSANDRVGIGTASPAAGYKLDVRGILAAGNSAGTIVGGISFSSRPEIGAISNHNLGLIANNTTMHLITPAGVFDWYDGVGGTRMTLDSTGLGVGASPAAKLHVSNGATVDSGLFTGLMIGGSTASARSASIIKDTSTPYNLIIRTQDFTGGTTGSFIVRNGSTDQFFIDSSGNVGVGVTPAGTGGCLQLKSGITFPATQVASSDANTLDDYEEGTFTPTVSATAGTLTTTTVNSATYTKIGRLVSVSVDISVVNIGTASGLLLFSLPFNQVADSNVGALRELGATGQMGQIIYQSATQAAVALYNNGTLIVNGYRFRGTYTYTV